MKKKRITVPILVPELCGRKSTDTRLAVLLKEYVKFWLVGVLDGEEKKIIFRTCIDKKEITAKLEEKRKRTLKELLK